MNMKRWTAKMAKQGVTFTVSRPEGDDPYWKYKFIVKTYLHYSEIGDNIVYFGAGDRISDKEVDYAIRDAVNGTLRILGKDKAFKASLNRYTQTFG
jgi:hypothetical protein